MKAHTHIAHAVPYDEFGAPYSSNGSLEVTLGNAALDGDVPRSYLVTFTGKLTVMGNGDPATLIPGVAGADFGNMSEQRIEVASLDTVGALTLTVIARPGAAVAALQLRTLHLGTQADLVITVLEF